MEYHIGICDDETIQLKVNHIYIKEIASRNQIQITSRGFCNSKQLFSYLQNHTLDILFLDIDLGDESGIDIASQIAVNYPDLIIIFLTGHREFTSEAFDVDAFGYLVKPINEQKLERTLKKAFTQVYGIKNRQSSASLIITEENIKKKINQSDILYIERVGAKSIIHTQNRIYQVYEPLTSLCSRLDSHFIRINQSEVVNRSEIETLKGNTVFLRDQRQLSIGRTYKKQVVSELLS